MNIHIQNIYITLCFISVFFSSPIMAYDDEYVSKIPLHYTYEDLVIEFEGHKWEDAGFDVTSDNRGLDKVAVSNTSIKNINISFRNVNPEYRNLYIIGEIHAFSGGNVMLELYDVQRGSLRHGNYRLRNSDVSKFTEGLNLSEYKWDDNKPVIAVKTLMVGDNKKDDNIARSLVNSYLRNNGARGFSVGFASGLIRSPKCPQRYALRLLKASNVWHVTNTTANHNDVTFLYINAVVDIDTRKVLYLTGDYNRTPASESLSKDLELINMYFQCLE